MESRVLRSTAVYLGMTLLVIGNYDNLNLDNDALTNKINVPHFVEKIIVHGFDI